MRAFILVCFLATPAFADAPVIQNVGVAASDTAYRFSVTIAHPDTGWDHYSDGWAVEAANGDQLGMRVLAHPHVNEQPFTRSLAVTLPAGTREVFVRSRCIVDGWSDNRVRVALP